ncbi:hypothetical protein NMY3_03482 [Candidatus Nitrosocosmicus oleophilus]|uniref:Uncharacterized protein n=1 Tax=Candidatus Nitrosocosmicus oleophilus TaxID=1353260 RepID=A0A654M1F9_9ARCH|nr:hypothetical protein NMY3_03482 [Candidatus Nitrosocosmicus oleophilus]
MESQLWKQRIRFSVVIDKDNNIINTITVRDFPFALTFNLGKSKIEVTDSYYKLLI